MKFDLPHISGRDAAEEVIQVGEAVRAVRAGQKVVVHPSLSCRQCEMGTSSREYFCRNFKIWGFQTGPLDGAHAEVARVPEANVVPMPSNLSYEEAASMPLVLLTSWHMLIGRAKLKTGKDVLGWGPGSGIGVMAIQIARLLGARVIAVAFTEEKLQKAKNLAADDVVNHRAHDVVQEVRRLTNKRGVEVVFEHVG